MTVLCHNMSFIFNKYWYCHLERSSVISRCRLPFTVKYAKDPAQYFAERIHAALKDDDDSSLIRLMVAHAEVSQLNTGHNNVIKPALNILYYL